MEDSARGWLAFVVLGVVLAGCGGRRGDGSTDAGEDSSDGAANESPSDGSPDMGMSPQIYCEATTPYDGCLCVAGGTRPGPLGACSEATISNAVCCATVGWPAGTSPSCSCYRWGCFNGGLCNCSLYSDSGSPDPTCYSGTYCCGNESLGAIIGCSCGSFSCGSWEVPLPDCSRNSVRCGDGQVRVTSCL